MLKTHLSVVVKVGIIGVNKLHIKHIAFVVKYTLLKVKVVPFTLALKVDAQNFVVNIISN